MALGPINWNLNNNSSGLDLRKKKKANKLPIDFGVAVPGYERPREPEGKIATNINNQSLMGFDMSPESKVPDPRTLGEPPKQENPYGMWGAKMFGGKKGQGISVGQFATVAGMAAHALAPNEASGRMGAGIAAIANQGEQDRLRFEANAPEREAALQRIKLGSQMLNERINDLPDEREHRWLARQRLMQDIGHTAQMNPLEIAAKQYSNKIQPEKDELVMEMGKKGITKADLDIGKSQFEASNMAQDYKRQAEKEQASIDYTKEATDSLKKRTNALIEKGPTTNTAQAKMEAAKALDTLGMKLSAKNVVIADDMITGQTMAVVPTNEKGEIPSEISQILDQSGIAYEVVEGEPIKKSRKGLTNWGKDYFRKVVFGPYRGNRAVIQPSGKAGKKPSALDFDED